MSILFFVIKFSLQIIFYFDIVYIEIRCRGLIVTINGKGGILLR